MAGQKRPNSQIGKPSDRLDAIFENMGFSKMKDIDLQVCKDYIFELGMRTFFSKIKPEN